MFTAQGTFLRSITEGFDYPEDVAVDAAGDVYVAATNFDMVQKFGVRPPRPDGRIRVGTGPLVGNDVYNTTGVDQTRRAKVRPGKKAVFTVSLQNDAGAPDRIRASAKGSTPRFKVVYRDADGKDITAAVTAGTWRTPTLASGKAVAVRGGRQGPAHRPERRQAQPPFTGSPVTDPAYLDVVRFVVVVR